MTFITLSILLIAVFSFAFYLLRADYLHQKKNFHFYDLPLDNKNKWWYN